MNLILLLAMLHKITMTGLDNEVCDMLGLVKTCFVCDTNSEEILLYVFMYVTNIVV